MRPKRRAVSHVRPRPAVRLALAAGLAYVPVPLLPAGLLALLASLCFGTLGTVAGDLRSLVGLRRALFGCLGLRVGAVGVVECALAVALGLLLGAPHALRACSSAWSRSRSACSARVIA